MMNLTYRFKLDISVKPSIKFTLHTARPFMSELHLAHIEGRLRQSSVLVLFSFLNPT